MIIIIKDVLAFGISHDCGQGVSTFSNNHVCVLVVHNFLEWSRSFSFGVDHACDQGTVWLEIQSHSSSNMSSNIFVFLQICLPTTNNLSESIMLMIEEYLILPPTQHTCLPTTNQVLRVDQAYDQGVPNTSTRSTNMPFHNNLTF